MRELSILFLPHHAAPASRLGGRRATGLVDGDDDMDVGDGQTPVGEEVGALI